MFKSLEEKLKYRSMYGLSPLNSENGDLLSPIEMTKIFHAKFQEVLPPNLKIDLYSGLTVAIYRKESFGWIAHLGIIQHRGSYYSRMFMHSSYGKYFPIDLKGKVIWDPDVRVIS